MIYQNVIVPAFFTTATFPVNFAHMLKSVPPVSHAVLDLGFAPGTGPPQSLQQFWLGAVAQCHQAKIKVLGYIATANANGTVTQQQICTTGTGVVDQWYAYIPDLDGIFFDEGPVANSTAIAQFYQGIYQCVKAKHPTAVVLLNAAGFNDPNGGWLTSACDIAMFIEDTFASYSAGFSPASWWGKFPPKRVMHTIHNRQQAQLYRALQLAKRRGAGYVYVFDGSSAAYDHLPAYWCEEQIDVFAVALGVRIPASVLAALIATARRRARC